MRICIQNLLHISADVSGPLLAEVAVAVFSFIRDTYPHNTALFIEFDTNNGYQVLENILKWWDKRTWIEQEWNGYEILGLVVNEST